MSWRNGRPDGWKNPYTKTGETLGMWALYEAGADAYEEGLKKDAFISFGDGKIADIHISGVELQGPGYLVFIPEEKE